VKICIDTTVLMDILKDEFRPYQELLYTALEAKESLSAPVVVFAELMPQFRGNAKLVSRFLREHKIEVEVLGVDAVRLAGERWLRYLKTKAKYLCPKCGHPLPAKAHVLSDFYIGGYALARCDAILTRDRGIYRKYFPDLKDYRSPGKGKGT